MPWRWRCRGDVRGRRASGIAAIGARYPDQAGATITVNKKASASPATAPASSGAGLDAPFPLSTDLQAQ